MQPRVKISPARENNFVASGRTQPATRVMDVFFLGDIVRIESQQFDLHEEAFQCIARMKLAHVFLRICPLIADREAAQLRDELLRSCSGQISEEHLPSKAVEGARSRSREPSCRI